MPERCVGICGKCFSWVSDNAREGHQSLCPNCGRLLQMTPLDSLIPGFQQVAEMVNQIRPVSIFHNKPICPWPILWQRQWHLDIRFATHGPYEELARKYFSHAYKDMIHQRVEEYIPQEAMMGDWQDESIVITQDHTTIDELQIMSRVLRQCRQELEHRSDGAWRELMGTWLDEMSLGELRQMCRQIEETQRFKGPRSQDVSSALMWLNDRMKRQVMSLSCVVPTPSPLGP